MEIQALAKRAATQEAMKRAINKEFEAKFLRGYVDLKRRVSFDHPDWDLSGNRGVEFDYWADEAPKEV